MSDRKKRRKAQWSRGDSNVLVMRALQRLVEYITVLDGETIVDNMDVDLRNVLTHNGSILDAFYETPDGKKKGNGNDFHTTKAKIKSYRQIIREKAASVVVLDIPYQGADEAVEAVFEAMKQKDTLKDIIAGLADMDGVKVEVVNQLNGKILKTA